MHELEYPFDCKPTPMSGSDLISIYGEQGRLMVTVKRDGTLAYGEGYTPDAAARLFWEALALAGWARGGGKVQ